MKWKSNKPWNSSVCMIYFACLIVWLYPNKHQLGWAYTGTNFLWKSSKYLFLVESELLRFLKIHKLKNPRKILFSEDDENLYHLYLLFFLSFVQFTLDWHESLSFSFFLFFLSFFSFFLSFFLFSFLFFFISSHCNAYTFTLH